MLTRHQLYKQTILERRRKYYQSLKQPVPEDDNIIDDNIIEDTRDEDWIISDDIVITEPVTNITSNVDYLEVEFSFSNINYPTNILPQFLLPQEITYDIKQELYRKMTIGDDKLKPEDIIFFKLTCSREERLDPEDLYMLPDEELLKLVDKYEYENSIPDVWALFDLSLLKFITNKNQKFKINDHIYYLSDEQWSEVLRRLDINNINVPETRKLICKSDLHYKKVLFMDRYFSEFIQPK